MQTKRNAVYQTYWYLAAERQNIFFARLCNQQVQTQDPILRRYKFCNSYRASDRVSQFLIKQVIYAGNYSELDQLFRIMLFRLFNHIGTWEYLSAELGTISIDNFDVQLYSQLLNRQLNSGKSIYGNAFILCANKAFGFERKHDNHLALLHFVLTSGSAQRLLAAPSLAMLVSELKTLPLIGNFMAYQIAIDLNYSELFNFSENDFTLAGPGALRGIAKAFVDRGDLTPERIIMQMVETQDTEFARYGINFQTLFGRPLQAIDCQGLFCELDKYSRVKFPELASNRVRIKTSYKSTSKPIAYFYPPKWGINTRLSQFGQAAQAGPEN
jgi:hypothetical protein